MAKKWNAQRVADLTEQETALKTQLAECTDKLQQMYATDGAMSDADREVYDRENLRHGQLTRDLQTVRHERSEYDFTDPAKVEAAKDSTLQRFIRGGSRELDADEKERFMGDNSEASKFAGGNGEVFMIDSDFSTSPPGGGTPIVEESE